MVEMIMMMALSVVVMLIAGAAIMLLVCLANKWRERYPQQTLPATVIARRTYIRNSDGDSYSQYYTTFRFESGECLELLVSRSQVGDLIEGDRGQLTFQGTKFLGFERT